METYNAENARVKRQEKRKKRNQKKPKVRLSFITTYMAVYVYTCNYILQVTTHISQFL